MSEQEVANRALNDAIDCALLMMWGWMGAAVAWYCGECGAAQTGKSPWPWGQKRCKPCGPGEGFVRCPYGLGNVAGCGAKCRACRGVNWLPEAP